MPRTDQVTHIQELRAQLFTATEEHKAAEKKLESVQQAFDQALTEYLRSRGTTTTHAK